MIQQIFLVIHAQLGFKYGQGKWVPALDFFFQDSTYIWANILCQFGVASTGVEYSSGLASHISLSAKEQHNFASSEEGR